MFIRKNLLVFCAALALIAVMFTGCKGAASPAVFGYTSCDAEFTIVFPSDTGDVECSATRSGGTVALTVKRPDRSAKLKVICSPDGCVIVPAGGEGIPLSSSAAEGLRKVFDILYRGDDGNTVITRTEDGSGTTITYDDGSVTVNGDLLPTLVEIGGEEMRKVMIPDYRITAPEQTDAD